MDTYEYRMPRNILHLFVILFCTQLKWKQISFHLSTELLNGKNFLVVLSADRRISSEEVTVKYEAEIHNFKLVVA